MFTKLFTKLFMYTSINVHTVTDLGSRCVVCADFIKHLLFTLPFLVFYHLLQRKFKSHGYQVGMGQYQNFNFDTISIQLTEYK